MNKIIKLIIISCILSSMILAKDTWYRFEDKQKRLIGHKDAKCEGHDKATV